MDFSGLGGTKAVLSLMDKLQLTCEQKEQFAQALLKGQAGKVVLVPTPHTPEQGLRAFLQAEEVPLLPSPEWLSADMVLLSPEIKPGKLPGFSEGFFYPLDLSSAWETSALSLLIQQGFSPQRFLDLCAAPGGKSFLTASLLSPQEHFANEIEATRLPILRHNLKRCGLVRSLYTQRLDPRVWAELAPESFDLIWVDAPCSGQSLLAKGIKNPGCFHSALVKGNAKRQRRILRHACECLATGGFLGYSTCSYSVEENENNVAWLLKNVPELSVLSVPSLSPWASCLSDTPQYRLMPFHEQGAGGFVVLFQKKGSLPDTLPPLPEELCAYPL